MLGSRDSQLHALMYIDPKVSVSRLNATLNKKRKMLATLSTELTGSDA